MTVIQANGAEAVIVKMSHLGLVGTLYTFQRNVMGGKADMAFVERNM